MTTPPPAASLDIVVPVYEEEECIGEFVRRVHALGLLDALLLVDNASTDATLEHARREGALRVIRHARNEGYGASIRDGIRRSEAEKLVIIDADLEYPPEAIPALLSALDEHAVVYASRFCGGRRPDMPWLRRVGNRLISGVFNLLFGQSTTDLYTGMKGLRRAALDCLELRRDGFEHVVEMGAQLAAQGFTIHEIPVAYAPRSRGASKMRHVPETLKYCGWVVFYWLRLRAFRRTKQSVGPPS